ncbi:hypothetical protein NM208_g962 [Fusarium decemcellulare]|uniref:Uncharacterized protein n=1 Tax=Fusarium decemcellulare TaxID=57161 RepID=A0ACC1SY05_9HYPO|nr:hypothetical protein NM208_g962 [Fusarium decemcellulare]
MGPVVASLTNIADSQNVSAPEFLGNPAVAQALRPKERFKPDALHAHIDGGNTRSDDFLGPLGNSPYVSSVEVPAAFMFWENSTSLLAAMSCETSQATIAFCLSALDPDTLNPLARWSAPNRTTVSTYWQIIDGKIIMPTLEGFILEVERVATGSETTFRRIREIDVSDLMTAGAILATAGYTDDGNLWFTATPAPLVGLPGTNTSTIGYVSPDNAVYSIALDNHVIENGMAVNRKTIYVVTGPSGVEDHSDAAGYFYAFQAAGKGGVSISYKEKYSAGSGIKPGGLARGSGATPGLLGQKYVAITDNADEQINLVVYLQADHAAENESSFVCSVPLFKPNGSGNEASLTTHFDGNTYSVMITNSYNSPTFLDVGDNVNGRHNDLSVAAPGVARIEVTENGDCSLAWELPVRATMTTLSTSSGLLYAYTQDNDLAKEGLYVWYIAAFNYTTGDEVWRSRVGAGGAFHPGVSHIQLGPGGKIYEGVVGGMAWLQDA